MRKVVAGLMISLDGVVESLRTGPARTFGEMQEVIDAGIVQADAILLGRRTYLEFADLWANQGGEVPLADFMNETPKYVASTLDTPRVEPREQPQAGAIAAARRVLGSSASCSSPSWSAPACVPSTT